MSMLKHGALDRISMVGSFYMSLFITNQTKELWHVPYY